MNQDIASVHLSPPRDAGVTTALNASEVRKDTRKRYRLPHGSVTRTPLYAHQLVGICKLIKHDHYALLDDMGLGKTIQALYAANDLMRSREFDSTIIVCKSSLAYLWAKEIETHLPKATYKVIACLPPNERIWATGYDFYITGYGLLSRTKFTCTGATGLDLDRMANFMFGIPCGMILDESHIIRNRDANVSQALISLASMSKWRTILTATLLAESVDDIWSQIFFLDGGKLLGTYEEFNRTYVKRAMRNYGGVLVSKVIGGKNLGDLSRRVRSLSIRRTKSQCLDLPSKTIIEAPVSSSGAQRLLCEKLRDDLLNELDVSNVKQFSLMRNKISGYMHDLQRAAAAPAVLDPSITENAKGEFLLDRLDQHKDQALVWCFHKDVCKYTASYLREHGVMAIHVDGSFNAKTRTEIVDLFQKGSPRVMVMTMDSMREGHTLTAATHAFYLELGWKFLNWRQSQDRLYRIGQTRNVTVDIALLDTSTDAYEYQVLRNKGIDASTVEDGSKEIVLQTSSLRACLEAW